MSTLPPEKETPVRLRAATELSARPAERSSPAAAAAATAAPAPAEQDGPLDRLDAGALAMAGVVLIGGVGWMMQRRHRLARRARPADAGPSQTSGDLVLAPEPRTRRSAPPGFRGKRMLVKFFMALRSVAGASAILAAIAFVVFWAIELIDASAREPRLNMALLGCLLAGGAGYWCSGRVANMLHRSVYNRDHPKFAD